MKLAANIISWIFVPLLMPIYGLLVAMYIPSFEQSFFQENTLYFMPPGYKYPILIMFTIFSFLAPGLSLLMLMRSKSISNIEIDQQEERGIPIIITAIYCMLLGILLIVRAPDAIFPQVVYALPWGGFLAVLCCGIINRFTKISLHASGAGMLLGFLIGYYETQVEFYFEIIVAAVIIAGLVMSARVYLGKHTLPQVFYGLILGFTCVYLAIFFFHYFK